MDLLKDFLDQFDIVLLIYWGIRMAAVLLCLVAHELSHGLAAHLLGDPTAKRAGRLSLNPIRHIDPAGFLMLLVTRVGWAKPVPVDMRYFKRPKRDMALTALAGPASNFLLAAAALVLAKLLLQPQGFLFWMLGDDLRNHLVVGLCFTAVLSVGLGLFNLIPIPPLDGSRLLCAVLPDRTYYALMSYERWLMLAVIALAWFGVLSGPLELCMSWVLRGLCALTRFPFEILLYYFGVL